MTSKRVAIIGAGPSGLAQMRAFESARRKGAEIPEIADRVRVLVHQSHITLEGVVEWGHQRHRAEVAVRHVRASASAAIIRAR